LKNKRAEDIINCLTDFFSKEKCVLLESDDGCEFNNKKVKQFCIDHDVTLKLFNK
jgi:hypothetical protein